MMMMTTTLPKAFSAPSAPYIQQPNIRTAATTPTPANPYKTVPNPYSTIGGSLLLGTGIGFGGASIRKLPEIKQTEANVKTLEVDGFRYREIANPKGGGTRQLERAVIDTNMRQELREVNPDISITFKPNPGSTEAPNDLPSQINVIKPINRTYNYDVATEVDGTVKTESHKATLTGALEARYTSPDFRKSKEAGFPLDLEAFNFTEASKTPSKVKPFLMANIDRTNRQLTYTDATAPQAPLTRTIDVLSLNEEHPYLLLDLRETLNTNVPSKDLEKNKATGRSIADAYQRVSTMPVDTKTHTWHPHAVEKLETRFNKAMLAYNGFESLEQVQAHKRLNFRTQGAIVGGLIGVTAGMVAWGYLKWKHAHTSKE